MYLSHPPKFLQRIYKSLIWELPNDSNTIYLTFDDGPTPNVTNEVLELLSKYNAKATFFCLGKNVQSEPKLYDLIIKNGHQVANHTYQHKNGWKSSNSEYLKDIKRAEKWINSNTFRPPYGKMKSKQIQRLRKKYRIIMWSVLTRDYDQKLSPEDCLKVTLRKVKPGYIFVFHDSLKAKERMLFALKGLLDYADEHQLNFGFV